MNPGETMGILEEVLSERVRLGEHVKEEGLVVLLHEAPRARLLEIAAVAVAIIERMDRGKPKP